MSNITNKLRRIVPRVYFTGCDGPQVLLFTSRQLRRSLNEVCVNTHCLDSLLGVFTIFVIFITIIIDCEILDRNIGAREKKAKIVHLF